MHFNYETGLNMLADAMLVLLELGSNMTYHHFHLENFHPITLNQLRFVLFHQLFHCNWFLTVRSHQHF